MTYRVESNLEEGAVVLEALMDALDGDAHPLIDPYADAVLATARSAAGGHPTRQSRMAASGLVSDHGSIIAPGGAVVTGSGGRPASLAEIIGGAEYGSGTFRQFAARNARGYWLMPSFEADAPMRAADEALEKIVRSVSRV